MKKPAIQVEGLQKSFNGLHLLKKMLNWRENLILIARLRITTALRDRSE